MSLLYKQNYWFWHAHDNPNTKATVRSEGIRKVRQNLEMKIFYFYKIWKFCTGFSAYYYIFNTSAAMFNLLTTR
jgi:hypothetical protein